MAPCEGCYNTHPVDLLSANRTETEHITSVICLCETRMWAESVAAAWPRIWLAGYTNYKLKTCMYIV